MKKNKYILILMSCFLLTGCVEDKSHTEELYKFQDDVPVRLVHDTENLTIYEQTDPKTGLTYLRYQNQQTGESFVCRQVEKPIMSTTHHLT